MRRVLILFMVFSALSAICGCSGRNHSSYKGAVEKALEQADLKGVKVSEDDDTNTITLEGSLHSEQAKARAGDLAKSVASGRVVANEISVAPVGSEVDAKEVAADLDDGIESNYKAALVSNQLGKDDVDFEVRNGVLTLTGKVKNSAIRQKAERIASGIPHVKQVVDQIKVER